MSGWRLWRSWSGIRPPIEQWISKGHLRYIDTRKSPAINGSSGLQLPRDSHRLRGSAGIVKTGRDLYNLRKKKATGGGKLYQFAGQNAQTADLTALDKAKQRIAAGEDAEAVRKDTGWHTGTDGKWRFEISDAEALPTEKFYALVDGSSRYARSYGYSLEQVLDHPRLYDAYPWIKRRVRVYSHVDERASAMFFPDDFRIYLNPYGGDIFSSLMHEIQHAIQQHEDFARGGQPDATTTREDYRRLAGEVEARNTQKRIGYPDDLRRATSPQSTADVAERDQIVTFSKGLAEMVSDKPTGAEITEAQRQIEGQLAIADLMIAERGGLFAPNGERSKLNRMQWAQVRTANFKRWFGDWEAAGRQQRVMGIIERSLTDSSYQTRELVAEGAEADPSGKISKAFGFQVTRQYITPDDVRKTEKKHGVGKEKAADQVGLVADDFVKLMEVLRDPDTFMQGKPNNGKQSFQFGKTFSDGVFVVAEVQTAGEGGVALKSGWKKAPGRTHVGGTAYPSHTSATTAGINQSIHSDDVLVNPASVSKVVDANGEPLAFTSMRKFPDTANVESIIKTLNLVEPNAQSDGGHGG